MKKSLVLIVVLLSLKSNLFADENLAKNKIEQEAISQATKLGGLFANSLNRDKRNSFEDKELKCYTFSLSNNLKQKYQTIFYNECLKHIKNDKKTK